MPSGVEHDADAGIRQFRAQLAVATQQGAVEVYTSLQSDDATAVTALTLALRPAGASPSARALTLTLCSPGA